MYVCIYVYIYYVLHRYDDCPCHSGRAERALCICQSCRAVRAHKAAALGDDVNGSAYRCMHCMDGYMKERLTEGGAPGNLSCPS